MATINHILIKDNDESSASDCKYFLCDICEFNGYPNEKVVYHYEGLRSEDKEGFLTRFATYDFPIQRGKLHVHKYNEKLIDELVNLSLGKESGVKT